MKRDEAGVAEPCKQAHFGPPTPPVRRIGYIAPEEFQGYVAAQHFVTRTLNSGHADAAQEFKQSVPACQSLCATSACVHSCHSAASCSSRLFCSEYPRRAPTAGAG